MSHRYIKAYYVMEAGRLLVSHLKDNRIVLANQAKALKTAKRNLLRYKKEEHKEYVAMKVSDSLTT